MENTSTQDTPAQDAPVQDAPVQDEPAQPVVDEPNAAQVNNNQRKTGRVKWFGKGFGFIKDLDSDDEYFVHHTSLSIVDMQIAGMVYKRLYEFEFVEFTASIDDNNRLAAVDVTGLRRLPLRCEVQMVRQQERQARGNARQSHDYPPQRNNQRRRGPPPDQRYLQQQQQQAYVYTPFGNNGN